MTSYKCTVCSKIIVDICEQICCDTIDCTCDGINKCQYCDYFICDKCYFTDGRQNDLRIGFKENSEDVCVNCLETKQICVSCHEISPDKQENSNKLEVCKVCKRNVCPSCVAMVDNLHFTAKKSLCSECGQDWNSRRIGIRLGEWYRTEYVWFHDGCIRTIMCAGCGREWCLDHDSKDLHNCANIDCFERYFQPSYCAKCIGSSYENQGYCSFCVTDCKIVKTSTV